MKNVVAKAIASGGTIPPAITAAITVHFQIANDAIPNTYAALLNGPPISIAIIPATTIPKITAELVPKLFKKFVNPLFKTQLVD